MRMGKHSTQHWKTWIITNYWLFKQRWQLNKNFFTLQRRIHIPKLYPPSFLRIIAKTNLYWQANSTHNILQSYSAAEHILDNIHGIYPKDKYTFIIKANITFILYFAINSISVIFLDLRILSDTLYIADSEIVILLQAISLMVFVFIV